MLVLNLDVPTEKDDSVRDQVALYISDFVLLTVDFVLQAKNKQSLKVNIIYY